MSDIISSENYSDIKRVCSERLEELIRHAAPDKCAGEMSLLFEKISFGTIKSQMFRLYLAMDVYITLFGYSSGMGVTHERFTECFGELDDIYEKARTADAAEEYLTRMAVQCTLWRDELSRRISDPVRKAKEYIDANYRQDGLTLKRVADAMNFTPAYFSALFKKEMKVNFSDYLTDVRISKAEYLLGSTSKMVYEIANEVGYSDYRYFGQIFKKRTGKTPKEYRQNLVKMS